MEKIVHTCRALLEQYIAIVVLIFTTIASYAYFDLPDFKIFISESSNSVLTVAVTLGGFILTTYAIINSVNNRVIKALKSEKSFKLLIQYMNRAVQSNFIVILLVFAVLLVENTGISVDWNYPVGPKLLGSFYVGFVAFTLAQSARAVYLVTRILTYSESK